MATIKDVLGVLPKDKRDSLMLAFNTGIQQTIVYAPGRFIAVHLNNPARNLVVRETAGSWSMGDINDCSTRTP